MTSIVFNPFTQNFDFVGPGGVVPVVETLTGNDGVVVSPAGNNINVVGSGVVGSGISTAGNIYVTGSGSTLTINETQAQFLTNYRQTATSSPVSLTDYAIGCTASNITITLPLAPAALRILIIKDESGTATATPITIAGNGKTINGMANLSLDQSYASFNLYYNGTAWFSY